MVRKTLPGIEKKTFRLENQTGIGKKTRPDELLENQTGIEIKQTNKTFKQKHTAEFAASFEKLKEIGFDDFAAKAIADRYSFDRVERQIIWMGARKASSNPLGMLRKAIEENWQPPASGLTAKLGQPNFNGSAPRGDGFDGALDRIKSRLWDQSSSKST